MAKQKRKKRNTRNKTQYQIWTLIGILLLFIFCLLNGHDRSDRVKKVSTEQKVSERASGGEAQTTPAPLETQKAEASPAHKKKSKNKKKKAVRKNPYDIDHQTVRVLVTTDGNMKNIFHSSVDIQGTSDYVVYGGKKSGPHKADDKIHVTKKMIKKAGKSMTVSSYAGEVQIASIYRQGTSPSYPGTLKLVWDKQGILVINEISVKEYLYRVLPSEMPTNYPMEALKAQAVCARSFIYTQKQESSYEKYGADIDDTAAFQVYNMIGTDERAMKAVDRTEGEMIFDGDEVILAYYYSTSWGYSATPDQVWGGESKLEYPCRIQAENGSDTLDLSDENTFFQFMTHDLYRIYDKDFDWYRWTVKMPADQLGAKLGIGMVKRIAVKEREKSGIMKKAVIVGERGRITLEGQQRIREMMSVPGIPIIKKNGEKVSQSMLPSATFFVTEKKKKKGANLFILTGGGMGHGVGLSQNGASEMAQEGKNYKKILKFYYGSCKIW